MRAVIRDCILFAVIGSVIGYGVVYGSGWLMDAGCEGHPDQPSVTPAMSPSSPPSPTPGSTTP